MNRMNSVKTTRRKSPREYDRALARLVLKLEEARDAAAELLALDEGGHPDDPMPDGLPRPAGWMTRPDEWRAIARDARHLRWLLARFATDFECDCSLAGRQLLDSMRGR